MLLVLQVGPLALYLAVGLHLHVGLAPQEAILLVDGNEVVEEQGVGPLRAVFGQHADEQAVHDVGLVPFQCPQDVPPAEGPQAPVAALLQCLGQRGQGDAHADDGMVLERVVLDEGDHTQVEHLEVHLDVLVNLLLRHRAVAVEVAEGLVDDVEDALPVLVGAEDVALRELLHLQVVALHDHLRNLAELLGHALLRHVELVLHVVVVLLVALHLLHQLGVVGVVVFGGHAGELVEAVGEHALGVHVGEAERSDDFLHLVASAEVLDGSEQGPHHVDVVDEVEPSEAHRRPLPLLVVAPVDDGGHAAHHLAVAQCQVVLGVAELEGGVGLLDEGAEGGNLVHVQVGRVVGVAAVQVVVQLDEALQVALRLHFLYFNVFHFSFVVLPVL